MDKTRALNIKIAQMAKDKAMMNLFKKRYNAHKATVLNELKRTKKDHYDNGDYKVTLIHGYKRAGFSSAKLRKILPSVYTDKRFQTIRKRRDSLRIKKLFKVSDN